MNAEYAELCAEFETQDDRPKATGASGVFGIFDNLISRFRNGWKSAGLKVGDFWMWLPVILQLIQVVGPKIMEIIQLIRDAIDKGKTPSTFDVAASAAML